MAKMTIPLHAQIQAPPLKVFELISDLTKSPAWATNPLTVEPVSGGPPHVGSKYHSTAKFMGKTVQADQEITDFEAPSHFGFTTHEEGTDYHHDWRLRASEKGTDVERVVTVEVPGVRGVMMRAGIAMLAPRLTKKNIKLLKGQLES